MERAENLARILDVNSTFAQDRTDEAEWRPILKLNSDEARFDALHDKADADKVLDFYILNRDNPSSILSSVWAARENARSLRHLISVEMWTQLNVFYTRLKEVKRKELRLDNLSRLFAEIKQSCQTHAGIAEGTLYHDQAWYFYQTGKFLERMDQTSRLLDIKYQHLRAANEVPGSPIDASQWTALLRSAAGYQAYRRKHPRGFDPDAMAAFLIFDPYFARSIRFSYKMMQRALQALADVDDLYLEKGINERLLDLQASLEETDIQDVLNNGLHEFADNLQMLLADLTQCMSRQFFGHEA